MQGKTTQKDKKYLFAKMYNKKLQNKNLNFNSFMRECLLFNIYCLPILPDKYKQRFHQIS